MAGISRVRTSVAENLLTVAQLEERGITNASVAASLRTNAKGWVAVLDGEIVGFSIADRNSQCLFALFVLPAHEGRGIGGRLLELAVTWLWANGVQRAWLNTGPNTKAARFYERRGWMAVGSDPTGDIRYVRDRPALFPAGPTVHASPTSAS